jgi:hypothetical protein
MIKIVIAQRGWVFVGKFSEEGESVVLNDAKIVRRWGTNKGLGQLAQEGKQPNTVLDEAGTVRVHKLATVAVLDCNQEKWAA